MKQYYAIYKCPLCGRTMRYGNPQQVPYEKLPELLVAVIKSQTFANNPYLPSAPMHIPCRCPDGNAGLAYFAGFKEA